MDGKPSKWKKNIVTEYADVLGGLKRHFKDGLGKFLLQHLNQAVARSPTGAVTVHRNMHGATKVGFSHTAMGFIMKPTYLNRLAVSLATFSLRKMKVDKATKGADSEAAAAWLLRGTKAKYKTFYARIKAQVKARSERLWKKVYAGALRGERAAWKKHKHIRHQAHGGIAGATQVFLRLAKQLKLPSARAMRASAKKLADKWRRKHKGVAKQISKVMKRIAKKASKKASKKGRKKKASSKKMATKKSSAFQKALKLAHMGVFLEEEADSEDAPVVKKTAFEKALELAHLGA